MLNILCTQVKITIIMNAEKNSLSIKIGLKIKFERQKRRLSQETLAELSCLSTNAIGVIERGKCSPRADSLEKIAHALKMLPHDLINVNKIEL